VDDGSNKTDEDNAKQGSLGFSALLKAFKVHEQPAGLAWIILLPFATILMIGMSYYFRILGYFVSLGILMVLFSRNAVRISNYPRVIYWGVIVAFFVPLLGTIIGFLFQDELLNSGIFEFTTSGIYMPTSLDAIIRHRLHQSVDQQSSAALAVKKAAYDVAIYQPAYIGAMAGAIWNGLALPTLLYFCPRAEKLKREELIELIALLILFGIIFLLFTTPWLSSDFLIGSPNRKFSSMHGMISIHVFWSLSLIFAVFTQAILFSWKPVTNDK
jgi:hypothetical protein